MKKIVSLIGVSAMVLMMGLGSGVAQQTIPKETLAAPATAPVKQAAPTDVVKEKSLPTKPGVEVKGEKGAPVAPSSVKASEKATGLKAAVDSKTEKAATTGKEMEKAATPKPNAEVKPDKATPPQSSVGQPIDKTATTKSALDAKSEKAVAPKPTAEKAPVKGEDLKPPAKQ
jgi:hypothetical protein